MAFLIVGLGNPGKEYAQTPHNIGFEVIDALEKRWSLGFSKKFHALVADTLQENQKVILMKPQTFMNRSGLAVSEAVNFFKIDPTKELLVMSDDLDLPPGQLRLRLAGGSGGHNGLNSIIDSLGTEGFPRLRIGIGREIDVLAKIPKSSKKVFEEAVELCVSGIQAILKDGVAKAMNTINQKRQTNGA